MALPWLLLAWLCLRFAGFGMPLVELWHLTSGVWGVLLFLLVRSLLPVLIPLIHAVILYFSEQTALQRRAFFACSMPRRSRTPSLNTAQYDGRGSLVSVSSRHKEEDALSSRRATLAVWRTSPVFARKSMIGGA